MIQHKTTKNQDPDSDMPLRLKGNEVGHVQAKVDFPIFTFGFSSLKTSKAYQTVRSIIFFSTCTLFPSLITETQSFLPGICHEILSLLEKSIIAWCDSLGGKDLFVVL